MAMRPLIAATALLMLTTPGIAGPTKVGEKVTGDEFRLMNGQTIKGRDFRGQVVVVNFWAQDCRACDEQLKVLDYYYRQRGDVGLVVLVSSVDNVSKSDFRNALKGTKLHAVREIRGDLEPEMAVPTTYFIDRTGKVRRVQTGAADIATLNTILVPLLKEPQPKDM